MVIAKDKSNVIIKITDIMYGIAGIFNVKVQTKELREKALGMSKKSVIEDRIGAESTVAGAPYFAMSVFQL